MRKSNPDKVLAFLVELWMLTKDKPTQLGLSKIIAKHKLSTTYFNLILETKILVKVSGIKKMAVYEWGSVRPPNSYMSKMLIHRLNELHKLKKMAVYKESSLPEPPPPAPIIDPFNREEPIIREYVLEDEFRTIPVSELSEDYIEENSIKAKRFSEDYSERKCKYDNVLFKPTRSNQFFCSPKCRIEHNNYMSKKKKKEEVNNSVTPIVQSEIKTKEPKQFVLFWGLLKFNW